MGQNDFEVWRNEVTWGETTSIHPALTDVIMITGLSFKEERTYQIFSWLHCWLLPGYLDSEKHRITLST